MSSTSALDPAISGLLTAKENAVRAQIGFAVAAKQLEATEQQGEAVNQLLEAAAQLSRSLTSGGTFDAVG